MGDEDRKSLYGELKDAVLSMGSDITVKPKVKYIAFVHKTNFMDVVIYRSRLNIFINMARGTLNDPKKLAEDVEYDTKMKN